MKKTVKKLSALLLTICLLVVPTLSVPASAAEITPYFNNVTTVSINMNINSQGVMTIDYSYYGSPSKFQKAVIVTYIEKKVLGLFWTRVDIGQPDDQWVDTVYDNEYIAYRKVQLSSKGTYRIKGSYTIYGSGGSPDVVNFETDDEYV